MSANATIAAALREHSGLPDDVLESEDAVDALSTAWEAHEFDEQDAVGWIRAGVIIVEMAADLREAGITSSGFAADEASVS